MVAVLLRLKQEHTDGKGKMWLWLCTALLIRTHDTEARAGR